MKRDEIIRVLRENAEWCDANEYEAPLCMGDTQREAASLLESQQSHIAELEAQLAASPPLGKRTWTAEDKVHLMDKQEAGSVPKK